MSTRRIVWLIGLAAFLASCSLLSRNDDSSPTADNGAKLKRPSEVDPRDPTQRYGDPPADTTATGSLFSYFFGNSKKDSGGGGGGGPAGVGVNSYLWRATLDTVSFMPLASADPFGGVIITDWFSPNESPNERFKVNVFILARELRADGVRCTVFRQKREAGGQWADAPVEQQTAVDIENAILTRARQMRLSTASK
ncbi:MAG TPA: DUF3576 domain-containing protein [Stellaceae bacterium]|nr:DUF3576 domain-containing protein [Stellaceae bacterium]